MNKFIKVKVNGHDWIVNVESIIAIERFGGFGNVPEEIYIYLPGSVKLNISRVSYDAIINLTAPLVLPDIDKSQPL